MSRSFVATSESISPIQGAEWSDRAWQLDRNDRDDRLRLAVLEHREIGRRQATDRTSVLVEDGDVELHDVDAGRERRLGVTTAVQRG